MRHSKKEKLPLTIGGKLGSVRDGDAEDVLVQVFEVKLTREIPLGVQSIVERSGGEDLSSHVHFTVRVTFTCRHLREWTCKNVRKVSLQDLPLDEARKKDSDSR